ncbi:hypothetical protein [Duganella sp. BuS-21]|uniref:hypothetical protein n=1 Tax=Duganella sp. BuS-21 TaxID=2943848 RepID=UPI0035A586E4
MRHRILAAVLLASAIAGCADIPVPPQSSTTTVSCTTEEPSTGNRVGKKRCS